MKIAGRVESLQKYVRQADYTFYNMLVDILMPDVLRPVPSMLCVGVDPQTWGEGKNLIWSLY